MANQGNGFDEGKSVQLLQAIQNGDEEEACSYISRDVDVNKSLQNGRTVLMLAAERGQSNVIGALIAVGADVNAVDDSRKTALMNAAENGHTNVLGMLSDNLAEVNRKDETGRTALMLAAERCHSRAVDVLLEAGAKVHIQSASDKETALTLVREERVLLRLIQSSVRNLTEEDIRNQIDKERTDEDSRYFLKVMKPLLPDDLSSTERSEIEEKLKQIPVFKSIREKLLKSGGYDVRQILHPETRYSVPKCINTRKSSCVNARGTPPTTWQVLAMLLCLMGGGYPIQSWWWGEGVPWVPPTIHTYWGVPQVPTTTIQIWLGGTLGTPTTIQTWPGGPGTGYPHPDLGWGIPLPPRPGMGYPPPTDMGWGTPQSTDLGRGTPPPQVWTD